MKQAWLCAALLTMGTNVHGQDAITDEQTVAEVELIGPNSPEFRSIAEHAFGAQQLDLLGEALRYFVGVRNRGTKTISELRIVYKIRRPDGRVINRVVQTQKLQLAPGHVRLETLLAPVQYAASGHLLAKYLDAGGRQHMTSKVDELTGNSVTASVDSITCADGEFIGPDTLGFADRLVTKQLVQLAFLKALVAMRDQPGDAVRQWLGERLAEAERAATIVPPSLTTADLGANYIRSTAPHARSLLDSAGRVVLFQWAENELAQAEARPALHRGGRQ